MIMPTVMKFGGTSVGDARAFENVAQIVAARIHLEPVVVVSAMSGVTDALLQAPGLPRKTASKQRSVHLSPSSIVTKKLL
jgi:aspartokinase